jgi:hypothetical protein
VVEGTRLESVHTPKGYRGFESLSLRHSLFNGLRSGNPASHSSAHKGLMNDAPGISGPNDALNLPAKCRFRVDQAKYLLTANMKNANRVAGCSISHLMGVPVQMKTIASLSLILLGITLSTCPAQTGYIDGFLTVGPQANVNLTTLGTEDWAVWGYASGGTSTSLAPNVSKSGGSGISDLTYLNPHSQPLRAIGQFHVNYTFSWIDGDTVSSASSAYAGLQDYSGTGPGLGVGEGFIFTVPADTIERTLSVFVDIHEGTGQLVATLSDGSAPAYVNSAIPVGGNSPGVYTIDYAAAAPGQTLTVKWWEISYATTFDNPAIFAAALSEVPEPGTGTLVGLAALIVAGAGVRRRS